MIFYFYLKQEDENSTGGEEVADWVVESWAKAVEKGVDTLTMKTTRWEYEKSMRNKAIRLSSASNFIFGWFQVFLNGDFYYVVSPSSKTDFCLRRHEKGFLENSRNP